MYIFILGNHPDISKAEIKAVLEREKYEYKQMDKGNAFLILAVRGSVFDPEAQTRREPAPTHLSPPSE